MATGNDELVRSSFDAFLRGDWDALAQVMDPGVQWLWYEPGDWDCHDRSKVLATLFERQREGVVTGLNAVVAVDERVFVEVTGPRLEEWGCRAGRRAWSSPSVTGGSCACRTTPTAPPRSPAPACRSEPGAKRRRDRRDGRPGPSTCAPMRRWPPSVTEVIRSGDAAELDALLREHPALAHARLGDPQRGQSRTLLHVVTDWPGHVPEAAAKIRALVAAGADVNARFTGPHTETPLHWAASSDDIDALDALLDAGADIEADGAVIGGGTPMADAVAFGQWKAARRLLERGARTNLWQAAALGLARPRPRRARADPAARARGPRQRAVVRRSRRPARAPPSCCSSAAPTPPGSATTSSPPPKPPNAASAHELAAWLREQAGSEPPPHSPSA